MRRTALRSALVGILVTLGACASMPSPESKGGLDPTLFFSGESAGTGVLALANGAVDRRFTVASQGQQEGETFVLDQTITFADGEVRSRQWRVTPVAPGHWRGMLTDATGAAEMISGTAGTLHIRYRLNDVPFGVMRQTLYAQPCGGQLLNVGAVAVAGLTVRRLHEVIDRADADPSCNDD